MSKVTLLDGGMGQELLNRSNRPVTSMWSADIMLHEPHLVRDLHLDFINSGAQVITLNNYTATPQRLERENERDQFENIHKSAIQAAQNAITIAQRADIKIAACLPPLVASYQPEIILPYEESLDSYRRLVEIQAPASDIILCETMASINEATAACTAALESGQPVWVALTVNDTANGKLRSGEPLSDAIQALEALNPDAILLNCSQPEAIHAAWPILSKSTLKTGAYANGFVCVASLHPGGTVENIESRQDLNPEQYADHAMCWAKNGASIIGGCCEITPAHIKVLHQRLTANGLI
jgi:S-methylmethionine-dependent homocysteine/selenocysteine methylase